VPTHPNRQLQTESYESRKLNVGDEITIRVVETGAPDEPNAPKPDPRFPKGTVAIVAAKPE